VMKDCGSRPDFLRRLLLQTLIIRLGRLMSKAWAKMALDWPRCANRAGNPSSNFLNKNKNTNSQIIAVKNNSSNLKSAYLIITNSC